MVKRVSFVLIMLIYLFVSPQERTAAFAAAPADRLTISNFTNGDTIAYDLPLLKGTAPGSASVTILVNDWIQQVPVNAGRWRAFVLLKPGTNHLTLTTAEGYQFTFSLTYSKLTSPKMVRMVYVLGSDSTGAFDAPVGAPHDLSNAVNRLKVAARMLQSMTAELLYEKGLPRRTFQLVTDASGEPVVDVTVVPRTVAELRAMDGMALWYYFAQSFETYPNRGDIKDIVIIADTHYDPDTGTLQAHTALGGGRLGLFGSATLYSWPETIDEIHGHFTDSTPIPPEVFPEYARVRQFWATYATSLGAVLHEFGHCVDLGHPQNPQPGDIMWRGFDFLNRLVVTYEPGLGAIDPASNVMPNWTNTDAETLQTHPWMHTAGLGSGSGGPVLVPGKISATPDKLVLVVQNSKPEIISTQVKVDLTWLDTGWTSQVSGPLAVSVDKTQGGPGEYLTITVNSAGYGAGTYNGSVTLTASDGSIEGSPLTIPVMLKVVDRFYLPVLLR